MRRKQPRADTHWRISDMAQYIPDETVEGVTPIGDDAINPSADRIMQLALEKRSEYLMNSEEKPVKKASFRVLLIAAAICVLSITAFAAAGGLDYMRAIFGDSAQSVQNDIVTPQVNATEGGRDMALEAVLTDGYITSMVVSLTGEQPVDETELFAMQGDMEFTSIGWQVMEDYSTKEKTFYSLELVSGERFDTGELTLTLRADVAPISLTFQLENHLGNAVVTFPEGAASGQTQLKTLQVSPMGFLLIGHEEDAQGGLPTTMIQLVYDGGRSELLEVEFAPSDETVGGGGGAIIGGGEEAVPLVTTFYGNRNPDGELVISGQFSRIIDPAGITKVLIAGDEYLVD